MHMQIRKYRFLCVPIQLIIINDVNHCSIFTRNIANLCTSNDLYIFLLKVTVYKAFVLHIFLEKVFIFLLCGHTILIKSIKVHSLTKTFIHARIFLQRNSYVRLLMLHFA